MCKECRGIAITIFFLLQREERDEESSCYGSNTITKVGNSGVRIPFFLLLEYLG